MRSLLFTRAGLFDHAGLAGIIAVQQSLDIDRIREWTRENSAVAKARIEVGSASLLSLRVFASSRELLLFNASSKEA